MTNTSPVAKTVMILSLISLFFVLGFIFFKISQSSSTSPAGPRSITLSEISAHSTAADCWMAISGLVYDVSEYISSGAHPGGDTILSGCGKDATQMFTVDQPHSRSAQAMLPAYQIGILAH